jgi:anthranilate phosphoribosyltransferase
MMAALMIGLRVKKETIGEITAAAQVMREFASVKVPVADRSHLVDIVGTGGDGSHTFNISTAHVRGRRRGRARGQARRAQRVQQVRQRRCAGGAGREHLAAARAVAQCIAETGIGFMFAPNHHPAMKNVAPVRGAGRAHDLQHPRPADQPGRTRPTS